MNLPTPPSSISLADVPILLIEDDISALKVYTRWLTEAGANVSSVSTLDAFKKLLEQESSNKTPAHPKIAITDLVLPDGTGLEVVNLWKKKYPHYPILITTAFASVENAVQAMKLGAFDFVRKPIPCEELVLILRRAADYLTLLEENETLSTSVRILGMAQTLSQISDYASLLKTTGRLTHRESKADECFVFFYDAKRGKSDCLLECRSPGLPRVAPEIIEANILSSFFEAYSKKNNENSPNKEQNTSMIPNIHIVEKHNAVIIEFTSQTNNSALIVLKSNTELQYLSKKITELQPILLQAARNFQNTDITMTLSFVDGLTGLYNQKFLEVSLKSEIARTNRYGTPVSVLFIDLDHFKEINDNHGHVVGSQLLKESANVFRNNVRESDFLLRFGGDEFVAILPNTDMDGAIAVAERIRQAFVDTSFDARKTTGVTSAYNLKVTTSIGVATYPNCCINYEELVQKADDAMYEAKRHGKNCVIAAITIGESK